MRSQIIAVLAASAVLAGCSSSTSGHLTGPSSGASSAARSAAPASGHYDAAIYFCTAVKQAGTCPDGATTAAQIEAVRKALTADRRVTSLLYVDEDQAVKLLDLLEPKLAGYVRVGDLPSGFLVSLSPASAYPAFRADYAARPGVGVVHQCGTNPNCEVSSLRAAGVVH